MNDIIAICIDSQDNIHILHEFYVLYKCRVIHLIRFSKLNPQLIVLELGQKNFEPRNVKDINWQHWDNCILIKLNLESQMWLVWKPFSEAIQLEWLHSCCWPMPSLRGNEILLFMS